MPILGAHMSIAGGFDRAVDRAHASGCDCVQIFLKNNNQWRAKPLTKEDGPRFQSRLQELGIVYPLAHSSYLLNLASPDRALWKKSVDAFVVEIQRADTLGVPFVVIHAGAYTTSTEAQGLKRIVRGLNEMDKQTRGLSAGCLLETTAGQGSCLGWRFEQLARLLDGVRSPERFGICFDTCHVFAAGYDLRSEKAYKATMREFQKVVGIKQIQAFHLNDSKHELGSRVDRHEHIGKGTLGKAAFSWLLKDRRFRKTPMYLETPKKDEKGRNLDEMNLKTLRRLLERG